MGARDVRGPQATETVPNAQISLRKRGKRGSADTWVSETREGHRPPRQWQMLGFPFGSVAREAPRTHGFKEWVYRMDLMNG